MEISLLLIVYCEGVNSLLCLYPSEEQGFHRLIQRRRDKVTVIQLSLTQISNMSGCGSLYINEGDVVEVKGLTII